MSTTPRAMCFLFFLVLALAAGPGASLQAAEQPLDVKQVLEEMARQRGQFDAKALHGRGVAGLTALIDYLLPETTPIPKEKDTEKTVRALIEQLGDDDFKVREQATARLVGLGRLHRQLVEKAATHNDPEVRRRAQQVLDAWAPPKPEDLSRCRDGLGAYLNGIKDADRLDLLTERVLAALQQGMPEGARQDLLRQLLAAIARGGQDRQWDRFAPLLDHKDVPVGVFVVATIGGCKGGNGVFPRLLLDALDCGREPIVDAAIDWTPNCWHPLRTLEVRKRLRKLFETGSEELKFQACFPLMHSYRDAEAYNYLLEQTQSRDPKRARTAIYWVGDTCHFGKSATQPLLEKLAPLLKSPDDELRRAAANALAVYQGEKVVENLLPLLADPVPIIATETSQGLLDQRDKKMLRRLLDDAAKNHASEPVRARAGELLGKIDKP